MRVTCERCQKEFRTFQSKISLGKDRFCSFECRKEALRRKDFKECITCGEMFLPALESLRFGRGKYCSMACAGIACRGSKALGKYGELYVKLGRAGYPTVKIDGNSNYSLHRYVAEQALGKSLPGDAVVHHIDGNKLNWANDNLVVLQNENEHRALHARQRALEKSRKCLEK